MRVLEIPEKLPKDLEKHIRDIFKLLAMGSRRRREIIEQQEHNTFD